MTAEKFRKWSRVSFVAYTSRLASDYKCVGGGRQAATNLFHAAGLGATLVRSGTIGRFGSGPATSDLPPSTDVVRASQHVSNVPTAEVSGQACHADRSLHSVQNNQTSARALKPSGPLSAFNDVKSGARRHFLRINSLAVLRTIGVATTNLHARFEQAFARYMIDLQSRTVGILKQHRIVARGEAVLSWLMNNFCADFNEEIIRLIDIAALTRAKTVMM